MPLEAGQQIAHVFGTEAQYKALKEGSGIKANEIYFITDTKQIYLGEDLYTGQVSFVAEFPETPSQGIIYVNSTTHETKVWNGASWDIMIPPISQSLDTAQDSDLVNAKAIKDYIKKVDANLVTSINYDEAQQKFTVNYSGGTNSEILLKNLITGASYDGETGDFTFTTANGEAVVVNTPKENFLASASYDPVTHDLTLTLTDDTEVKVNLEELIDTYTVKATSTVELAMSPEGEITANVKKSATEKNALVLNEDGLFVPEALVKSVANTQAADVAVSEDGQLTVDVNISAEPGNQLSIKADGLFAAAADLSNYYNKSEVDGKLELKADKADTYTKAEVNALVAWKAME